MNGPLLFARYAYPPNALGYCGPADSVALFDYLSAEASDAGLRALARGFEGAWPYLQLVAASNGIADPLDARVVEAYWVGNRLLDRVDPGTFAAFLHETFDRRVARRRVSTLASPVVHGAVPHHNFHVFGVYPWTGLLRAGHTGEPLRVVDGCRIRWGTVLDVANGTALVVSRPVTWNGTSFALGLERPETVRALRGRPGDVVAMHWNWICDTLTPARRLALERATLRAMRSVNAALRAEKLAG